MAAKPKRIRVIISGRVQGVFYRAYTLEEARRLGLRGWVMNLPDGRVEVLAEGDPEKLKALEAWCWEGPTYARVSEVAVREEMVNEEEFTSFDIRYSYFR
jgi:acylphosphatase